jgi:hypothetical protein
MTLSRVAEKSTEMMSSRGVITSDTDISASASTPVSI